MSRNKTLVVILCMHRCGSSLTARLLERLGMSLGPFELGEVNESNKYGHFEAQPFVLLNRELQLRQFGFEGDMPDDPKTLGQYLKTEGRWPADADISDDLLARGRDLVEELAQSGDVSGFKDPRTVLTWPYWQRVFAGFPELRIVPLALLRSPHEIAMSLFCRSRGGRDYGRALDATAIHFQRMGDILESWRGPSAVVQFDPKVYDAQARRAAEICGLAWSDAALTESYDAACRHFDAVPVEHPAQAAFERVAGLPPQAATANDFRRLIADAAKREAILQEICAAPRKEAEAAREERDQVRYELTVAKHEIGRLTNVTNHLQARADMVLPLENRLNAAIYDLGLIRGSRTWKFHEAVSGALRFKRVAGTNVEQVR